MDQGVVLVPLLCTRCKQPVPAEPDQVAWSCQVCGQGLLLDDELGLQPIEINYSAAVSPDMPGRPFWVASGSVTLQRQTFGSSKNQEAEQFWNQERLFFVPAFTAALDELLTEATSLVKDPPQLSPGPAVRFLPVTLDIHDVPSAAEFIVMAIEADRRDRVKEVVIQLQLSKPVLWILP